MSINITKFKRAKNLPRGHVFGAKWRGQKAVARVVDVKVGVVPAGWWCAGMDGTTRRAVEVTFYDRPSSRLMTTYVDFEDGVAITKLTKGQGMPEQVFKVLPVRYLVLEHEDSIAPTYK